MNDTSSSEASVFASASVFATASPDKSAGKRGWRWGRILEDGFLEVEEGAGEVVEDPELEAVHGGGPDGLGGEEFGELEAGN